MFFLGGVASLGSCGRCSRPEVGDLLGNILLGNGNGPLELGVVSESFSPVELLLEAAEAHR